MEKFDGGDTINSRIKIDYTGKKTNVKFSFPNKNEQKRGSLIFLIYGFWIILNLPFLIYYDIVIDEDIDSSYATINKGESEIYNLSNYTDFVNYLNNEDISYKLYNIRNYSFWDKLTRNFNYVNLIWAISVLIIPGVIYFIFRKKWDSLYPDVMAFVSSKKITEFKSKDVIKDVEGNYYCEIPLFNNVLLDYQATKDFSKFLKFFEIKEHNFKYINRKKSVNESLWYARFYFSKKPIDGKLEVKFK